MALKDWVLKEKWDWYPSQVWYGKKDKYSYVKAWKTGLPAKEMRRRGHVGTFIFEGRLGRGKVIRKKYFKTKKQALAYAKAYMKKH